jgi:ADP-heptose:LPS heptosyltransferase
MDRLRHMAQQVHFHKPNPDQMLVGIDPGLGKTGHAAALDNLQYLAGQLTQNLMCRILPLADPADRERLEQFETRLSDVPSGLSRDTVLDMVLLLAQCDLLVAGNTDLFHFAVALGIPAIGLFSPSDPPCWVPDGRNKVKVLVTKKGKKVEIETLLEAVEEVTEGRTRKATSIMSPEKAADLEKKAQAKEEEPVVRPLKTPPPESSTHD